MALSAEKLVSWQRLLHVLEDLPLRSVWTFGGIQLAFFVENESVIEIDTVAVTDSDDPTERCLLAKRS